MTDWRARARRLVDDLTDQGLLADPRWRSAFEAVPRHVFVPRYHGEDGLPVDGANPEQRDAWLDAVYADSTLVTQVAPVPGTDLLWSTSSSTMPSLMARMLELLDVSDNDRVLEIGTGSGYNAALLCHRLTDTHIASIDLDPTLIADAQERLATLGYRPHLVAGDGAAGIPGTTRHDRIIATCAVPAIPPAWITQLAPDGLIVADVRGEIASSLVVLRRTNRQTVRGRFLAHPGHFMWLRAEVGNPLRDGGTYETVLSLDHSRQRTTDLDPASLDDPNLRFVLQLLAPDIRSIWLDDPSTAVDIEGGREP
ncbi:MAG: hypothetical protein HY241_12885 [Actinobacteria bacterium]|nr:hypothetical protein [Actinomycetota bacterium]